MLAQPVEHFLAQAGDQQAVLAGDALAGPEQLAVILVAQVGHQHHQGAAALARQQLVDGSGIVGRALGALQVVHAVEQVADLGLALGWGNEARLVAGEGRQPHRVTLAQGHVGQQQAGIEGVVEMSQIAILAAHAPAAVEQEDDLLVPFVLVLAGDRRALARSGFPVDLA